MPHTTLTRRLAVAATLAATLTLGWSASALAQAWPRAQPIKLVAVFPPGGSVDQVARILQGPLQQQLGQTVVVENKGGASGSIGTAAVAAAPADGYTFAVVFDTHGVNPSLIPSMPFDTRRDLVPVALVGTGAMVLATQADSPYKTFADVVAAGRTAKGVSYGSIGSGSLGHLAVALLARGQKLNLVHVPYRGGAPAVAAAAAGDVQLTFANFSDALTWMRSGRLRPIALTSAKRFPQAPDVPTIAESGLPGYEVNGWSGLLAPAGTPPAIIDRIAKVLQKDFAEPAMRKRWEDIGAEPGHADPAVFAAMIRADMQKWSEFVKRTGIKVE